MERQREKSEEERKRKKCREEKDIDIREGSGEERETWGGKAEVEGSEEKMEKGEEC